MAQGNFQLSDNDFNSFLGEAVPYLDTNKTRLSVSNPNMAVLNDIYDDASGVSGWLQIWPKSQSANQRTKTITAQKDQLKEDLTEQLRLIYKDIPESVLTQNDRDILRIFEKDMVPSERPAITTSPFVDLKTLDGANVKFTCRVEADSSRASRQKDANFVEVMWELVALDAQPPTNPASLPNRHTSTSASFTMAFGVENAGKRLYCFVRWANLNTPSKSGPWAQIMTTVISD